MLKNEGIVMKKGLIALVIVLILSVCVGMLSACEEKEQGHKHFWGDGVVTLEAKCYRQGQKLYTCSCGETKTEVLEKTDEHSWVTQASVNGGTIEGSTICNNCGIKKD